ncbi:hypothetical protein PV327_008467 [Microctonus hyperodae]|uniref:Uncharacterized protein n=1 Tax=Microctonus hyperodae TaxID=165561 RepID=A0AA39F386_MICHY|nr:hypothetical protein PV327_008467 [Microctonus hyperodae]
MKHSHQLPHCSYVVQVNVSTLVYDSLHSGISSKLTSKAIRRVGRPVIMWCSAYIIRWSAPQLMVVAVQYILTGPYIPPYVPQNVN